jgi:hypothetical protein
MADSNFTLSNEIDEYRINFPRLSLSDPNQCPTAIIAIHPETLASLTNAARIQNLSLLDFLINSAWCTAREILSLSETPL